MRKPLIGVLPLWDETKDSLWMLPGYMDNVENAGGVPVMLPLTEDQDITAQIADTFDGFLFAGGQDISPYLYGEEPVDACRPACGPRDSMEALLFQRACLELGKPVLGICRGIQMINVLLGGALYQDLPSQYDSGVQHQQTKPSDEPAHQVSIIEGTPLHQMLGNADMAVNSCHHQAICTLSDRLRPMALSEDGLIEAVYMPDKEYLYAVQWHPECMPEHVHSKRLFSSFIEACMV